MTRRTSQSMRRSVGDLRVCRVRSDLAEALPLRARRQQQAPNSDGRGYGAAFNAARDQLLANKPCAPKAAGRSRIPLSTILRPVALGVPDVDNIAFLETLCSSFQAGETAARAEAHT